MSGSGNLPPIPPGPGNRDSHRARGRSLDDQRRRPRPAHRLARVRGVAQADGGHRPDRPWVGLRTATLPGPPRGRALAQGRPGLVPGAQRRRDGVELAVLRRPGQGRRPAPECAPALRGLPGGGEGARHPGAAGHADHRRGRHRELDRQHLQRQRAAARRHAHRSSFRRAPVITITRPRSSTSRCSSATTSSST